jgi:glycosyltransferase involved in cell wall biosynthesis
MKLSIVIPYHNRRQLLINVLDSMNLKDVELIIVDDGSKEPVDDLKEWYPINLIKLPQHDWCGACIAYNTGFGIATGDVIMLNSSEVTHHGNVIGYVFENFKAGMFMSFAARMSDPSGGWWGVHSTIGNFIPYCAVISRKDMELLSGYDERFAKGIGFDDYDFTHRVRNLGLKMICVDDPFVVHQYHEPTKYINTINKDLLDYLNTNYLCRIKAPENKVYKCGI